MAMLLKMQKPIARSVSAWCPQGRTWAKTLAMPELLSITRSTAASPAPTARSAGSQDFADSTVSGSSRTGGSPSAGALALDPGDIGLRMGQRDRLLHVLAQRRLLALQVLEQLMGEHLVDGAHAVRPLWVAEARVMLDEAGMGEEKRGHDAALYDNPECNADPGIASTFPEVWR